MIDLSLVKDIIRTYRGWDEFEKGFSKNEIIDFDLTPSTDTTKWTSRIEILEYLRNLYRQLKPEDQEQAFLKAKINASIFFLRASLGEQIPFEKYIENTLGVTAALFEQTEIEEVKERIAKLLAEVGIKLRPEDKARFEEIYVMYDPQLIRSKIEEAVSRWLLKLQSFIEVSPLMDVKTDFVSEDAYWANWVSVSIKDGVKFKINLHPRIRYLKGSPTILAVHEFCGHIIQGQTWIQQIKSGHMNEACGLITVHGPEAFVTEGVASILIRLLVPDEELSNDEKLTREFITYRNHVYNNAHYMINTGVSFDEVYRYMADYLPFDSAYKIESEIRDRSINPLLRAYQYSYGISEKYFMRILKLPFLKQKEILQTLYRKIFTKNQIDLMFQQ